MSSNRQSILPALAKFGLLVAILAAFGAAAWRYNVELEVLKAQVASIPAMLRFPAFVGLFVLVSVAPVPARDVVKITGAVLFGGLVSGLLVWIGEMGAAVVSWLLGRLLGRDLVERLVGNRLDALEHRIERANWRQVALLRLFPATPYRLFNYAASLSHIPPAPYFLGSAIGMLPRTLAAQYLIGVLGAELGRRGTTTFQVFLFSIVISTIAIAALAVWSHRRSRLARAEAAPTAATVPPR